MHYTTASAAEGLLTSHIEHIGSNKQRDRREGLQELKHVLGTNKRSNKHLELRDRGYHAIFESLFRFVNSEKANYLRYSKGGRSQAATTLSECAGVFRLAIDVGWQDLRPKTLRAVLDHITEILPNDDGFCEPLVSDYLRALKTILQYPPHPAHLTEQQWRHLVEFCHSGISQHILDSDEPGSFTIALPPRPTRLSDRLSRASSPHSVSGSVTPMTKSFLGKETRISASRTNHIVNDLIACLYHLLRVPHAPVMAVGKATIDVLHEFLGNTTQLSHTQGQEKAFGSMVIILSIAQTEGVELASSAYERALASIRRLWHTKAHDALKEQMLACLVMGLPLLDRVKDSVLGELEPLLAVLTSEYCRRHEKDMLQFDDLELLLDDASSSEPFVFGNFRVRTGSSREEQSAAILLIISSLLGYAIDDIAPVAPQSSLLHEDHSIASRKRQKMTNPMESFMDSLKQHTGTEQIARIQIFAILCSRITLSPDHQKTARVLAHMLISAGSDSISTWSMCAVAQSVQSCLSKVDGMLIQSSLAVQSRSEGHMLSDLYQKLWNLGTRRLTDVSTSRAACYMLTNMSDCNVVDLRLTNDTFDTLQSSVEFNGPACFDDCSALFWCRLITFKAEHNPSSTARLAESMLRWMFLRWKPCMYIHATAITY